MVGEKIAGRFEIEELVGHGGMSSVYKAHDALLERNVALKILHEQYTQDDDFVERFKREARSVAQLTHPNIVTVIDRGEEDGRQYIVFEYVEGENLKELVTRQGKLPVAEALEVARGLAFAHEHGIVHRDVKPQNVLLNGDGRAKVTDFGIARSVDVEKSMTETGTVLGTSSYIAPEQATGQPVDAHSDIYSLGVVLYELLAGEPPFPGENFVAVAMKHVHEPPPSLLEARPDAPLRVAAAVDRALEKDPEQRFPSMAAFAGELEACLAELERPDSSVEQTTVIPSAARRPRRQRKPVGRVPVLIVIAALLAIGAIVAGFLTIGGSGGKSAAAAPVGLRGIGSYDPYGDKTEHSERVADATDRNPATYWTTEQYRSPSLAWKHGVGLVLDARRPLELGRIVITSDTPGFTAQIQGGNVAGGPFKPISGSKTVGATTSFDVHPQAPMRYYVVWITRVPTDSETAHVNEVRAFSG